MTAKDQVDAAAGGARFLDANGSRSGAGGDERTDGHRAEPVLVEQMAKARINIALKAIGDGVPEGGVLGSLHAAP